MRFFKIAKLLSIIICCFVLGCKGTKQSINKNNDAKGIKSLSLIETQKILQEALSTNHINALFTEEEKSKGVSILITDVIEPFYKYIQLEKFGKKVKFQTQQEVYDELNEKFLNIVLGYIEGDKLKLYYIMSSRSYAMEVDFIKRDNKWIKATKDFSTEIKPRAIYNYKDIEVKCLAYSILLKKYPKKYSADKYSYMRDCSKYD